MMVLCLTLTIILISQPRNANSHHSIPLGSRAYATFSQEVRVRKRPTSSISKMPASSRKRPYTFPSIYNHNQVKTWLICPRANLFPTTQAIPLTQKTSPPLSPLQSHPRQPKDCSPKPLPHRLQAQQQRQLQLPLP